MPARRPALSGPFPFVAALVLVSLVGAGGALGGDRWLRRRLAPGRDAATVSDWTTFDQNGLRTGVDASGNSFSPATPAWTSPTLDGQLYGQPLVYSGRVYAATENDTVYALAADTGPVLWSNHLATPFTRPPSPACAATSPPRWASPGTPVIDPARVGDLRGGRRGCSPVTAVPPTT